MKRNKRGQSRGKDLRQLSEIEARDERHSTDTDRSEERALEMNTFTSANPLKATPFNAYSTDTHLQIQNHSDLI